ncbi:hypothetical protein B0A55_00029 [Friedmanniomyces simplex]|uniref:Uncharacterized protein n=1 Tax=Friedmanniomyces simplex TaxID=329884 RepID=A0A4U0Y3P1_9PEZI|nr:hypothetical protein B0A55_00029 [Friedmanniomyces simplex]
MEDSLFGSLSAELRNQIYDLVIHQPSAVRVRYDQHPHSNSKVKLFGTTKGESGKAARERFVPSLDPSNTHSITPPAALDHDDGQHQSGNCYTGNGSKAGNASAASTQPFGAAPLKEAPDSSRAKGKSKGKVEAMTKAHQPQRGPTRHQRSAQISEEVRALNRDVPSLGASKPPNDSADFTVGPQGLDELAAPGRMGENTSPEREGPYNQGAGRYVRGREDEQMGTNESQQIRGVRTTEGKTEEPLQGGAAVLEAGSGDQTATVSEQDVPPPRKAGISAQAVEKVTSRGSRVKPASTPYHPRQPTMAELTTSGANTSTIAANNFTGVLADRIALVSEPGQIPIGGARDVDLLAHKLLSGQITRLTSQEEKETVLAKVKEMQGYEANKTSQQKANQDPEKAANKREQAYFLPLPETVRKCLVDKVVRGVYDREQVLAGTKHKQPVLNMIARATMMNDTFLRADSEKFLRKVRSLLPVGTPQARAAQKLARK